MPDLNNRVRKVLLNLAPGEAARIAQNTGINEQSITRWKKGQTNTISDQQYELLYPHIEDKLPDDPNYYPHSKLVRIVSHKQTTTPDLEKMIKLAEVESTGTSLSLTESLIIRYFRALDIDNRKSILRYIHKKISENIIKSSSMIEYPFSKKQLMLAEDKIRKSEQSSHLDDSYIHRNNVPPNGFYGTSKK